MNRILLRDNSQDFTGLGVGEGRAEVRPGRELRVQVDGVAGDMRGIVRWVSADASFTRIPILGRTPICSA